MDRRKILKSMVAVTIELPRIFVKRDLKTQSHVVIVKFRDKYVSEIVPNWKIKKYPMTFTKVLADLIYRVYPDHSRINVTYQEGMWTVCLDNKSITTKDHTQINRRLYEMQMR